MLLLGECRECGDGVGDVREGFLLFCLLVYIQFSRSYSSLLERKRKNQLLNPPPPLRRPPLSLLFVNTQLRELRFDLCDTHSVTPLRFYFLLFLGG